MSAEMPPLIPTEAMAEMTGVNVRTIREKCATGELPAVKVGRRWFVVRDELLKAAR